jgi:DNA-binding transcriptional LysR family regulator
MELRHLRYFVVVGEEQHFRNAAQRLNLTQPALSRQIQSLEDEIGFQLFERLRRGVRLNPAGKLFLQDARRILQQVHDATTRAHRVATGQTGTLRVGFVETMSWHGVVPKSFRRFRQQQPDAELQLHPLSSLEQIDAIRSGRLDAGFIFSRSKPEGMAQVQVASHKLMLAVPKGHHLTGRKTIRLRDLRKASFIWIARWVNPVHYDRLAEACARGGLKTPHVVQEAVDQPTILSLVSCRLGIGFVSETARWLCPGGVSLLPVSDLNFPLSLILVWREDDHSILLHNFVADVRRLPEAKALGHSEVRA